jgi:hypothetical protein
VTATGSLRALRDLQHLAGLHRLLAPATRRARRRLLRSLVLRD